MKKEAKKEMEYIEKMVAWRNAAAEKGNKKRADSLETVIGIRLEELANKALDVTPSKLI